MVRTEGSMGGIDCRPEFKSGLYGGTRLGMLYTALSGLLLKLFVDRGEGNFPPLPPVYSRAR